MASDIIRAGRFFDEEGLGKGELIHPLDCLINFPHLIGIDHQVTVGTNHLAGYGKTANVVFQITADLHLHMVETGIDGFLAKTAQLGVVIAKPAGRRGIAGVTFVLQRLDTFPLAAFGFFEDRERIVTGQHVRQIAIIDDICDFFRAHVGDKLPHRLARLLCQQIPYRIHNGAGGEMHRALVRADPAQLAVARQMPPIFAGVLGNGGKIGADHQMTHRFDGHAADVIAAADGEGQPVAFETRLIGIENDISRRIIRVGVHRIRTVETLGGRKTQVENTQISNFGHGRSLAVSVKGNRSIVVEGLFHHRPPLAFLAAFEWLLAGNREGPPFLVLGAFGHLRHVGADIGAVIFPIAEEQIFRLAQEDRVIADIAVADERQNFRPDGGVQPFIFRDHVRFDAYDHAHTLHEKLRYCLMVASAARSFVCGRLNPSRSAAAMTGAKRRRFFSSWLPAISASRCARKGLRKRSRN
ncbi:hypothetical protein D3C86_1118060 [compost metagenome]